eukprot:2453788-Amphidinium_carterae.2
MKRQNQIRSAQSEPDQYGNQSPCTHIVICSTWSCSQVISSAFIGPQIQIQLHQIDQCTQARVDSRWRYTHYSERSRIVEGRVLALNGGCGLIIPRSDIQAVLVGNAELRKELQEVSEQ